MKTELLNEENYQKIKKKISYLSIIVLIIGIFIGGSLITVGFVKKREIDLKYSEENINKEISNITILINSEKEKLNNKLSELQNKIEPTVDEIKKLERVQFDGFNDEYYERKDKIEELKKSIKNEEKQITSIESYIDNGYCFGDEITKEVCSLQSELNELENMNLDFKRSFNSSKYTIFFVSGGFIIVATLMISGSIYMASKRREMAAFSVQQMRPIFEEGMEKISPSIGKAGKNIMNEMAPGYGKMAKEIAKGIKEGIISDDDKKKK